LDFDDEGGGGSKEKEKEEKKDDGWGKKSCGSVIGRKQMMRS
jgi:hypothetical protein